MPFVLQRGPAEDLRARLVRRLATRRGAFSWLEGYGLGPDLTGPIRCQAQLHELRDQSVAQALQEPDVQAVEVGLSLARDGTLTWAFDVQARGIGRQRFRVQRLPDGTVT